MNDPLLDRSVFLTLVRDRGDRSRARALIDSIRSFGGSMSHCPIWLFQARPKEVPCESLAGPGVQVFPLGVPEGVGHYLFADKVYACARAEEWAAAGVRSLIWIDPMCLIVQPPLLFDLAPSCDAAVRPVHIRNVGLPPEQPLDDFWGKVYQAVGVQDIQATVESYVDAQRIRAYFNSHAFAINPAKGLLGRWFQHFAALVSDEAFQAGPCRDEWHQIFLFQAVWSALLVTKLEAERIHILPPGYSYPYNLQSSLPPARRARVLNELVCIAYEDRSIDPQVMDDIEVQEPLRSWLSARSRADSTGEW